MSSIDFATREDDPAGFGTVSQHSINRIDPRHEDDGHLSTAASLVDDGHSSKDA
jgi:hypothetical protein